MLSLSRPGDTCAMHIRIRSSLVEIMEVKSDHHFSDIFWIHLFNAKCCTLIQNSLKIVSNNSVTYNARISRCTFKVNRSWSLVIHSYRSANRCLKRISYHSRQLRKWAGLKVRDVVCVPFYGFHNSNSQKILWPRDSMFNFSLPCFCSILECSYSEACKISRRC